MRKPQSFLWCAAVGILLLALLVCGADSLLSGPAAAPAPVPTAAPSPSPEPTPTPTPTPAPAALPVGFTDIAAQNSDMYGWIVFPETDLNYPVFNGPAGSDDFYLDHAADKSYDPYGCVYSEGGYNAPGFVDRVTMLYGHDVYTTDTGFHPLHHLEEAEFRAAHRTLYTFTADACQQWRVVGVCTTDDSHVMYENGSFQTLQSLKSWLETFSGLAGETVDPADPALTAPREADRYLLLSTCNQISQDQRYLTLCVLENTLPAA